MTVAIVKKRRWTKKGVDVFERNVVLPLLEHDEVEAIEYDSAKMYQTPDYHWLQKYVGRFKRGRAIANAIQKGRYEKVFLPFQELLTFDPSTVDSQVVPYVHDIIPATTTFAGPIPTLLARQYVQNLGKCDLVLCASEWTKGDLLYRTPYDFRVEVVYQGVEPPDSVSKVDTEYDLMYVGSLFQRKNPTLLRQCIEQAANCGFDCIAVLSENADGTTLPCEVRSQVSKKALWELYASSRFYLHPSKQEGFGRPPVEAQRIGTPVIAHDIPINEEVLGRRGHAWIPIDRSLDVTEILRNTESVEYADLCAAGIKNAARFDWDDTYERIRGFLLE